MTGYGIWLLTCFVLGYLGYRYFYWATHKYRIISLYKLNDDLRTQKERGYDEGFEDGIRCSSLFQNDQITYETIAKAYAKRRG